MRWLMAWAVDRWMRACPHDGRDVLADLLEGDGRPEVQYCRRCGAVRRAFEAEWRRPRPLWAAEMRLALFSLAALLLALALTGPVAAEEAGYTPLPYSTYPVPLVSAILHNQSAAEEHYRIKVQVRGKE